jgi:hypothetical protein
MDMDDYTHPMTSTAYSVEYDHVPVGQLSCTVPFAHNSLEYHYMSSISYFGNELSKKVKGRELNRNGTLL